MDFETLNTMMQAETSQNVKYWMRWMMFIFFVSFAFMARFKSARWAAAAIPATIVLAVLTWGITKNIHLFGIPHLIIWTPLAIYLWKAVLSPTARAAAATPSTLYSKAHMVWAALLFITIIISLPLDVRDIYLVMTGAK